MGHIATTLPKRVEQGAIRTDDWSTEIVTTDGGHEVRNARWDAPLRTWEISFPTSARTGTDYLAVVALYDLAKGSLHTFNFIDWIATGEPVRVRFDSPLRRTGVDRNLEHIETLTIKEVRE